MFNSLNPIITTKMPISDLPNHWAPGTSDSDNELLESQNLKKGAQNLQSMHTCQLF